MTGGNERVLIPRRGSLVSASSQTRPQRTIGPAKNRRSVTPKKPVSLPELLKWSAVLWSLEDSEEFEIDFRDLTFFTPFAMVFMAHQIKAVQTAKNVKPIPINHNHLTWINRMGFMSAMGVVGATAPGEVAKYESKKYIPLTVLDAQKFTQESGYGLSEVNEAVERKAARFGAGFDPTWVRTRF
jgi:hypothetical protein